MTKAEKKYVVAWTHAQARHYAQTMDWSRMEWEFVNPKNPERLLGLHSVWLYEVRAPCYQPNYNEKRIMDEFWLRVRPMIDSERIIRHNVVNI